MAKTSFATNDALTRKLWHKDLYNDTMKELFWYNLMGTDMESPVCVKEDLTKEQGDNITFGLVQRSDAPVKNSGEALEGNEDSLSRASFSLSVEERAFALRDRGPLDRQRAIFNIDDETKRAIVVQGAEYIDQTCFDALQNAPTKTVFGGSASSVATLTATDLVTPEKISEIKAGVKTGYNRTQTPIRPFRIDRKNYYGLVLHPDAMYDLQQNSAFQQARREALERSRENPIWSDVYAIWDGVAVFEHENISIANDGGAGGNISYCNNIFFGAQALVFGWAKKPEIVSEEFDYKREHGHSWQSIYGVAKPTLIGGNDYGSVSFVTARTQIADA